MMNLKSALKNIAFLCSLVMIQSCTSDSEISDKYLVVKIDDLSYSNMII